MRDAGTIKELPFLPRDGALVADRERGKDAFGRRGPEHGEKSVSDRLTRELDVVQKIISEAQKLRIPGTHVPGGPDTPLEEPRLVIEAMRIDDAVRAAQAHGERPALARMHAHLGVV